MNEPNVPLQKFKIRCYLNKKMVKYDLFLEAKYNFDTNCVALSVQKVLYWSVLLDLMLTLFARSRYLN